jgi:ABC-2 type transport system permease protein
MNITLLKTVFKKNWLLLVIFYGVLTMYMAVMISMYDPNDIAALSTMMELFPEDLMKAMGFSNVIVDLTGYLASWLYGLLMLGFPLVYCTILGNRLVAKMVDNCSFAYLLSTPNSRVRIIITQGIYALASVVLLFSALFATGVLMCALLFPGALDIGAFLKLNVTTMLVNMAVMMISFFFSCLFNDAKLSLSFGAGIPIVFLLMHMLGGVSPDAEFLNKLSIYGIYDPVEVVQGGLVMGINLMYISIILILFAASVLVFNKKRLPI